MQPSTPDVKVQVIGFWRFLLVILKRRIFLLFVLLSIVTLILQLATNKSELSSVYLGLLFVGFVWSAYQVHRDLALAYQEATTPKPVQKNRRSGLSISFVPGNEYAYSIADPYAGQEAQLDRMQNTRGMHCHFDERGRFFINDEIYYSMSRAGLEINMQILNPGDGPLDVVAIHVNDDLDLNHLRMFNEGIFLNGGRLPLPLKLGSGELVTLQARQRISLAMGSNDGLFAADFQALPRLILHEVMVEATDSLGKRQAFWGELKTASKDLKELYYKQWREFDQRDYLMLAGGSKPDAAF